MFHYTGKSAYRIKKPHHVISTFPRRTYIVKQLQSKQQYNETPVCVLFTMQCMRCSCTPHLCIPRLEVFRILNVLRYVMVRHRYTRV